MDLPDTVFVDCGSNSSDGAQGQADVSGVSEESLLNLQILESKSEVRNEDEPSSLSSDIEDGGDAGLGNHSVAASRTSSLSSDTAVCRICQSSGSESGLAMQSTGCACKGNMSNVHEQCLRCWVQAQRSLTCEICRESYRLVEDERINASRVVAAFGLNEQLGTTPSPTLIRICTDPRRGCFGIVLLMLAMTTISAASLTRHMEKTYKDVWHEHLLKPDDQGLWSEANRLRMCYQMVLSILVVLATMTFGVFLMWLSAEIYFWPRQRIHEFNWRALVSNNNTTRQAIY